MNRSTSFVAIVCLLLLLVSACGGSEEDAKSSSCPEGFCSAPEPSGGHMWSTAFGDDAYRQRILDIAVDADANVWATGYFEEAIVIGDDSLTAMSGYEDMFLVKFDAEGNHLWSKQFDDGGSHIAADSQGNVVIASEFSGSVSFGDETLTAESNDGGGSSSVYLAKLDGEGNHLWSTQFTGTGLRAIRQLAFDADGNVFAAGGFETSIDFGDGPVNSPEDSNTFLVKFDADGNLMWSNHFVASEGYVGSKGLAADAQGNIVLGSSGDGVTDFGGGELSGTSEDIFIAKFSADGEHLWSKRLGAADDTDRAGDFALDADGNIVFGGTIYESFEIGGETVPSNDLSDGSELKLLVAKLDAEGNHIWSNAYTSEFDLEWRVTEIATAPGGDVVAAGAFTPGADLRFSSEISLQAQGAAEGADFGDDRSVFVVRLDPDGNPRWASAFGGTRGELRPSGLDLSPLGSVALSFYSYSLDSEVSFGGDAFGNDKSVFLVKLAP